MLRVYCNYSYAGYKLYNLTKEGPRELTSSDRCGISQASITYFSRYGLKEAYLRLPDGSWMLLVHDIPSSELDDLGRKKNCSLQLIATGRESRLFLAKMAIAIANDMNAFERFFASLFTIENELKFDYDSLSRFLSEIDKEDFEFEKPLDRVYNQSAPLLLYSGNSLASSISEISHLISKNDLLKSVAIKWDIERDKPSSMRVMKYVYDIIQRILDKFNIWHD